MHAHAISVRLENKVCFENYANAWGNYWILHYILVPRALVSFSHVVSNLVPRVLRLLGQRFGRRERLWGNGIFSIFLIGYHGYSGNNEIGEAEVGSLLTLPSIMSRTSQETSAIFQRGQQVTLLVRDWRISIHLQHLLVSAFG